MNFVKKPIFLSLLSALLLSLPWFGAGAAWILVGFVPLLVLQKMLHDQGLRGFLWWVALTLTVWIASTCYWVTYAFWGAAIAIPAVGVVSLWPAWWIYHAVWKRSKKALAYTILISGWVALEWWYAMGDVSFPWLTLGNAWGEWPWAVQWYSATGVYGGTLWILVANVAVYTALVKRRVWRFAAAWIAAPVIASLVIYWSCEEPTQTREVAVIQPNIDPYSEKYSIDGLSVILPLAATAPPKTELFVAPETSLSGYLDLDNIAQNQSIIRVQEFLRQNYGGATFIIGVTAYRGEEVYNSVLSIDTARVEVYHKGKLVIGVESVPSWAAWLAGAIDLGGYVGSLGRSDERTVFQPVGAGAAICYESIYGEYFSEWVARGAQIMTVVTNDGWWGDTPGYRHHASYARLRAVENRRSIARSANTGISELITPRGQVVQSLGWDKRGILCGSLAVNDKITPYTAWGDLTARLSLLTLSLSLLFFVGQFYRRKV